MSHTSIYRIIILIGLLPTIGIFIWGVNQSLKTKSVTIVPWFSTMK